MKKGRQRGGIITSDQVVRVHDGEVWPQADAANQWQALLWAWIEAQRAYVGWTTHNGYKFDLPYRYTERADIGMLAAGAVSSGWTALEEFSIHKKRAKTAPATKVKEYEGRCDLLLGNDKTRYLVEAKATFPKVSSEHSLLSDLWSAAGRSLKAASKAAKRTAKGEHGYHRVALSFVAPRVPKSCRSTVATSMQQCLLERLETVGFAPAEKWAGPRVDFCAAYLPRAAALNVPRSCDEYFIGVVMLGHLRR